MNASLPLLREVLDRCPPGTLLVADENCADLPFPELPGRPRVVSNRWEVAERAAQAGLAARFCDFDLSEGPPPRAVVFRIAKEKAVIHRVVNEAARVLAPGGRLWVLGGRREGIDSLAKGLAARFGAPVARLSARGWRALAFARPDSPVAPFDDRDYPRLREIARVAGKPLLSKPGLFSWDRIDPGSALLAAQLPLFLAETGPAPRLLDLGCGTGYLALAAHALAPGCRVLATDNCAAALLACRENFLHHGVSGEVVASDCAAGLAGPFDLVLCNPPFHRGFSGRVASVERFVAAAARLLAPRGQALFVANRFVPLARFAARHARAVRELGEAGGYRLVAFRR
ncbi:MAG: ribosomal RNA small subunit methyltransferase C [Porticoccaceae bacterium]|nr:MAG: ribosomal RNA small subunit methyltransferase C [Porticoccaceae bacterium]